MTDITPDVLYRDYYLPLIYILDQERKPQERSVDLLNRLIQERNYYREKFNSKEDTLESNGDGKLFLNNEEVGVSTKLTKLLAIKIPGKNEIDCVKNLSYILRGFLIHILLSTLIDSKIRFEAIEIVKSIIASIPKETIQETLLLDCDRYFV
jgi:hypothetical protein